MTDSSLVTVTDPLSPPAAMGGRVRAYVALTKPRIIELLLITTVPPMVVATGGWPGTWLVIATLVGGALSAGGANVLNNFVDHDIDLVMSRTSKRPLPQSHIEPDAALRFGIALGAGGFFWLWAFTNVVAAALSTGALLFYVFVYTIVLKRSTRQNIVIGGAAGAAPVLVGWAAVTGSLSLTAWVMFAVVFYWTPPHFWALAIRYRADYARADIPMLPVVASAKTTNLHMMWHSAVMVLCSLLVAVVADLGWIYMTAALGLGIWFMLDAIAVARDESKAMRLFRTSTVYLAVIFAAIWVDVVV